MALDGTHVPCWTMGQLVAGESILMDSGGMGPVAPVPAVAQERTGTFPHTPSCHLQR